MAHRHAHSRVRAQRANRLAPKLAVVCPTEAELGHCRHALWRSCRCLDFFRNRFALRALAGPRWAAGRSVRFALLDVDGLRLAAEVHLKSSRLYLSWSLVFGGTTQSGRLQGHQARVVRPFALGASRGPHWPQEKLAPAPPDQRAAALRLDLAFPYLSRSALVSCLGCAVGPLFCALQSLQCCSVRCACARFHLDSGLSAPHQSLRSTSAIPSCRRHRVHAMLFPCPARRVSPSQGLGSCCSGGCSFKIFAVVRRSALWGGDFLASGGALRLLPCEAARAPKLASSPKTFSRTTQASRLYHLAVDLRSPHTHTLGRDRQTCSQGELRILSADPRLLEGASTSVESSQGLVESSQAWPNPRRTYSNPSQSRWKPRRVGSDCVRSSS